MRRILTLAALLALASPTAGAGTLDRIRETGVFRIGYRADARPYSYQDRNAQPSGYIVDLCTEIATALGPNIQPQYVRVPPDRRFEAVRDGHIDILCDSSSVTMPRREMVDFSLPTFIEGAGVISRTGKPVGSFEDLGSKRVGVLAGSTSEAILRKSLDELKLKAEVIPAADYRSGLDLLTDGKIDAYFGDRGIIAAMLREGGWPGFAMSHQYFSYETYALALARDDGALRLLVDRTLTRLYRTGKIDAILQKTFGQSPADEMLKAMIIMNSLPDR
jgi:polar amino acid transport system substrate-binding protein